MKDGDEIEKRRRRGGSEQARGRVHGRERRGDVGEVAGGPEDEFAAVRAEATLGR